MSGIIDSTLIVIGVVVLGLMFGIFLGLQDKR